MYFSGNSFNMAQPTVIFYRNGSFFLLNCRLFLVNYLDDNLDTNQEESSRLLPYPSDGFFNIARSFLALSKLYYSLAI